MEKKETNIKTEGDEPIYEAVIPREEPMPVCVSPPPLPTPPRLCSESPKPTLPISRSNNDAVSLLDITILDICKINNLF